MQVWWRRWDLWVSLIAVYALMIAMLPYLAGEPSQSVTVPTPEQMDVAAEGGEPTPAAAVDETLAVLRVPVLRYRALNDSTRRARPAISPARLEEHLKMLATDGYKFAALTDVLDALRGNTALPDRTVALTFDAAGNRSDLPILAVVQEQKVPATFLLSPSGGTTLGALDREGLRDAVAGGINVVGKAVFNTERTVQSTPDALGAQMLAVQNRIADLGIEPLPALALMVVSPTQEEVRALAMAGFEAAITLQAGVGLDPLRPFELPVISVTGDVSVDELRRMLSNEAGATARGG